MHRGSVKITCNAVFHHGAMFWLQDQLLNTQSQWKLSGWCQSRLLYEVCHGTSTRLKQTKTAPFVHNVVRPEQKLCPPGVTLLLIPPVLLHYNKETLEWNRWLLWQHYTSLLVSMEEQLLLTIGGNTGMIDTTQSMQSVFCTLLNPKLITREHRKSGKTTQIMLHVVTAHTTV